MQNRKRSGLWIAAAVILALTAIALIWAASMEKTPDPVEKYGAQWDAKVTDGEIRNYAFTTDGRGVYYARTAGNGFSLYHTDLATDGETLLAQGVGGYLYSGNFVFWYEMTPSRSRAFYRTQGPAYGKGTVTVTEQGYQRPLSVCEDTCYYLVSNPVMLSSDVFTDEPFLYYHDGGRAVLVTQSATMAGYFCAKDQLALVPTRHETLEASAAYYNVVEEQLQPGQGCTQWDCCVKDAGIGRFSVTADWMDAAVLGYYDGRVVLRRTDGTLAACPVTEAGTELPQLLTEEEAAKLCGLSLPLPGAETLQPLFRNLHTAGPNEIPQQVLTASRLPQGEYVSSACVYMTPLSSYLPVDGDSGRNYEATEDAFRICSRSGEVLTEMTPQWGWREWEQKQKEVEDGSRERDG